MTLVSAGEAAVAGDDRTAARTFVVFSVVSGGCSLEPVATAARPTTNAVIACVVIADSSGRRRALTTREAAMSSMARVIFFVADRPDALPVDPDLRSHTFRLPLLQLVPWPTRPPRRSALANDLAWSISLVERAGSGTFLRNVAARSVELSSPS